MDSIDFAPDYSKAYRISGNFTASTNGVLYIQVIQGTRYNKGTIRGIGVINTSTQGTANITEMTGCYLVKKGDPVVFSSISWNNAWFVPME